MSLPLMILLLLVMFAGLSMQFAGLYIRRGDSPACRQCGYDLTSHQPTNCPECNADLTQSDAIVRGVRRPRLIWLGTSVVLVGGLALAFLLIRAPGFDKLKPVWLLRAEMAVMNDQVDERILKEFGRRVQSLGVSVREKNAIGRLAVDLVRTPEPDASAYELLKSAASARAITPEQAEPIILTLVEQWTSEMDAKNAFAYGHYVHREVLGALIGSVGIEIDALRPVIEAGNKAAALPQSDFAFISMCCQLLWNWWESPSSPGVLTHDFLTSYYEGSPEIRLDVRPKVTRELGKVPIRFWFAMPPLVGNKTDAARYFEEIKSIRVRQGERILEPKYSSFGSSTVTWPVSRYAGGFMKGGSGTTAGVEGLEIGPAELIVELHIKLIVGQVPAGTELSGDIVDTFPPIFDRMVELRTNFEVVAAVDDGVTLRMPGEEDVPDPDVILENLRVSPLLYSTAPPFGSQGPWAFKIGSALISHERRGQEQWIWPEINVAYLVIAEQDGHVWDLGYLVQKNFLQDRHHPSPLWGTLVPTRVGESGTREWAIPVPDFDKPVRVRLLPDPDRARQTIDMHSIYGAQLDLGLFEIERTEDASSVHRFQSDELRPIPALMK